MFVRSVVIAKPRPTSDLPRVVCCRQTSDNKHFVEYNFDIVPAYIAKTGSWGLYSSRGGV